MVKLQEANRKLWLWLMYDGGAWTNADLAAHLKRDAETLRQDLYVMAERSLIEKLPPLPGQRNLRYAVTGTCLVPYGLHLAEVQADTIDDERANDHRYAETSPQQRDLANAVCT